MLELNIPKGKHAKTPEGLTHSPQIRHGRRCQGIGDDVAGIRELM